MAIDFFGETINHGDIVVEIAFPERLCVVSNEAADGKVIRVSDGSIIAYIWTHLVRKATKQELEVWVLRKLEQ